MFNFDTFSNLSLLGSNDNNLISVLSSGVRFGNVIPIDVQTKSPFSYSGSVAYRGSDSLSFNIESIHFPELELDVSALRKMISKISFSKEFNKNIRLKDGSSFQVQGMFHESPSGKRVPALVSIAYQSSQGDSYIVDISRLKSATTHAVKSYFSPFSKKLLVSSPTKAKTSSNYQNTPITLGEWDGVVSDSPIVSYVPSSQYRSSSPKEPHVKSAFIRQRLLKSGKVRESAILPSIIHPEEFSADDFREELFTSKGQPTLEALVVYQGKLPDTVLKTIVKEKRLPLFEEVYGHVVVPELSYKAHVLAEKGSAYASLLGLYKSD